MRPGGNNGDLLGIRRLLAGLHDFLTAKQIEPAALRIGHLDTFLAEAGAGLAPKSRRTQRRFLRGFLRYLYQVRGVQGVEWAMPLYKGSQRIRLDNGEIVGSVMLGLDDATLIGGPAVMLEGRLADLRLPDSVIVDEASARSRLAKPSATPGGKSIPLRIGDVLEINDKRATVVGIARGTPTFQSQPILYTTYNRAKNYALSERKLLSYILVKAKAGESPQAVARRISRQTGMAAYTAAEFKHRSLQYFIQNTSILTNFGFVVIVGFIVGAAVTGQIFYNFTLDNLRTGVSRPWAPGPDAAENDSAPGAVVGFVGFGIGAGAVAAFARPGAAAISPCSSTGTCCWAAARRCCSS
jgi:putative ABC transport system permease protein